MLFSKSEATQLIGYLEDLLSGTGQYAHYHLNNSNYSKEITIALYDKNGCLDNFAKKYKELILSEE